MKKESEKLTQAKKCVDACVKSWNRTQLTDIEKWSIEEGIIWGISDLALYLLSPTDYQELKNYVLNEYGHNVGGAIGSYKGMKPDVEYISKQDLLDASVLETLSDYTDCDVIHVGVLDKLPTYTL